jgi:hypothetical protein
VHYEFIPRGQIVKQEFYLWLFYGVYKKQCKRNDQNFDGNKAVFFIMTPLLQTHSVFSVQKFLTETKLQWFHSHPTALVSLQSFLCSQTCKLVQKEVDLNQYRKYKKQH